MARGVWSCLPPLSPHKTQNRPSPPPLLPPSRRDILGLQLSAAHACIRQTHSREETNNEQYSNKSRGYGECGKNAHRMRRGPRAPIQVACFFHYTRLLRAPSWAAKINERTSLFRTNSFASVSGRPPTPLDSSSLINTTWTRLPILSLFG
jgi:hypothetical protein